MLSNLLDGPGITIFTYKIYAYAIIIVCGMAAACLIISTLFKRRNMSADLFLTYFCITLPVALVTTRLFYCITDGLPISQWFDYDSIRSGGLSIIGGILGGAVSVIAISYFKKVNFFRVADCIVVGLMLAQAVGRWGNFANQEVYGAKVTNSALQCFPFAVYINTTDGGSCWQTFTLTFAKWFGKSTNISGGTWHYAFFFYESIINFIVSILLFINAWKNPKKPNGINLACYLMTYGLVRSIMEPLRDSSYILQGGGIKWSFVVSISMFLIGVGLLVYLLWNNKRKEGTFIGSLNGDPYGITAYIKDNKDEVAYLTNINMMCKIYPNNYVKKESENSENSEQK
jgi:phosphatidylglycerol:prolipoprotein diacylglycerol transferase